MKSNTTIDVQDLLEDKYNQYRNIIIINTFRDDNDILTPYIIKNSQKIRDRENFNKIKKEWNHLYYEGKKICEQDTDDISKETEILDKIIDFEDEYFGDIIVNYYGTWKYIEILDDSPQEHILFEMIRSFTIQYFKYGKYNHPIKVYLENYNNDILTADIGFAVTKPSKTAPLYSDSELELFKLELKELNQTVSVSLPEYNDRFITGIVNQNPVIRSIQNISSLKSNEYLWYRVYFNKRIFINK